MYSGQGAIGFPLDAAARVGRAETSQPFASIVGVGEDDFSFDRDSFGIFNLQKKASAAAGSPSACNAFLFVTPK
jgi:hypothetical protein